MWTIYISWVFWVSWVPRVIWVSRSDSLLKDWQDGARAILYLLVLLGPPSLLGLPIPI